jgi:hypothetical protein
MRIVRHALGARLVDGADVVSDIRSRPGPTDGFFDLLAASVASLAPGPRVALLGFAGGGVIAPLRALGFRAPLDAVDWSRDGYGLFRELCGRWAGEVRFHRAEATAWLARRRRRFDLILEDLAVPGPDGMTKPDASLEALPERMRARLARPGIVVTNLLPVPGLTWRALVAGLSAPWRAAVLVSTLEYENRILIAGDLPRAGAAREVSRRLRAALRRLGSLQAERFSVRTVRAAGSAHPSASGRHRRHPATGCNLFSRTP